MTDELSDKLDKESNQNLKDLERKYGPLTEAYLDYLHGSICTNPDGTWYRMNQQKYHGRKLIGY